MQIWPCRLIPIEYLLVTLIKHEQVSSPAHLCDDNRKEYMRINVYSQELTTEVVHVEKESNTGIVYHAAQLILHSSERLHHPPQDDDRSAVTFWLPKSDERREEQAKAFEKLAEIFRTAPPDTGLD